MSRSKLVARAASRGALVVLCCWSLWLPIVGSAEGTGDARRLKLPDGYSPADVLIAAHRGGYRLDRENAAPENSVANIAVCRGSGFQLYETDLQRTRDGHFVIMHDPTIDRETNGSGVVAEMDLAELLALRKRYRDGSLSSESVATLEQFLSQGSGRTLFKVDLKPGVSSHFPEIMAVVSKLGAIDGVIFRVPFNEVGLFSRFKERGIPIADHTLMFKVSSKAQVDQIKEQFGSLTIQVNLSKSNPGNAESLELIRYATRQGFVVETHAEGDEADWARLVSAGVRIFHTSAPTRVKAFLQSASQEQLGLSAK